MKYFKAFIWKTHSVAVRALSNKWVKIIYKIWEDEIFYDEEKKISPAAWHSGCAGHFFTQRKGLRLDLFLWRFQLV